MKLIKIFMVPRARDDEVLEWLRLRRQGHDCASIAHAYGQKPAHVRTAMSRVREADLAESGEDPQTVKGAYA